MKDILYTVARLKSGSLIKAVDADKGFDYFCPACSNELILRKSGNTGKNAKRAHFAHKNLTPNCTPETALHFLFKTLLFKKIEALLGSKHPLSISWECNHCDEPHSGNLLKKIRNVRLEYNLSVCRPDIALLDEKDNVFAVIEIIVTHKPAEQAISYYAKNKIILIQIQLNSDTDLDQLENKITNPDSVSICYNPECDICGHYKTKTRMWVIEGFCWKCNDNMKVAVVFGGWDRGGTSVEPSRFTSQELNFAKQKGVIIKEHFSKTVKRRYMANTCGSCNAFVGEHFLFGSYIAPASYNELEYDSFDIGYHCNYCIERHRAEKQQHKPF